MLDIGREPQSQWVTQKPLRAGSKNDQTGRVRITHYPNTLLKHFYRGNTNFCTWVGSAPVACQGAECLAFSFISFKCKRKRERAFLEGRIDFKILSNISRLYGDRLHRHVRVDNACEVGAGGESDTERAERGHLKRGR